MKRFEFKHETYLKNSQGNIKHIILTQKGEFRSRFNNFWNTMIGSTLIALPYFVIGLLLCLIYAHANTTIIQIICMVSVFLLIPIACVTTAYLKSTIENYIFDEFIFPQIKQKYIKNEHEDFKEKIR